DNNYFNDTYQGIPIGGYTQIVEKMLDHPQIDVKTGVDFFDNKEKYLKDYPRVIFTGMIDQYFNYQLGELEYRSLRFESEELSVDNYQGNAVVNYTDAETPFTRIIEHKHFQFGTQPVTYLTKEYPQEWHRGEEAYYPVNDRKNQELYNQYAALAQQDRHVIFGGRLGEYRYYNMDQVTADALAQAARELA
ncbi:MAG TPA: UDP-galactopyranose mutase, partial [Veillonellaceae bacterium]|nr:UDP-galactopyranose mutase [Veillonellaceae bacterium]